MAQSTNIKSARGLVIEFGVNGTTWTDASGYGFSVEVSGGEREAEGNMTADGDTEAITAGKRKAYKVKFKGFYTESATEITKVARTAQEAASAFYMRWAPLGATVGNMRNTTSQCVVTSAPIASPDASDAKGIPMEIEMTCSTITEAAIP